MSYVIFVQQSIVAMTNHSAELNFKKVRWPIPPRNFTGLNGLAHNFTQIRRIVGGA
jgi:hypothetical protein